MNPLSSQDLFNQASLSIRFVLPELILVGSACALFLLAAFRSSRRFSGCLALGAILAAAGVLAGAGTFAVEFGVLSRLTGDPRYARAAKRAARGIFSAASPVRPSPRPCSKKDFPWTVRPSRSRLPSRIWEFTKFPSACIPRWKHGSR